MSTTANQVVVSRNRGTEGAYRYRDVTERHSKVQHSNVIVLRDVKFKSTYSDDELHQEAGFGCNVAAVGEFESALSIPEFAELKNIEFDGLDFRTLDEDGNKDGILSGVKLFVCTENLLLAAYDESQTY